VREIADGPHIFFLDIQVRQQDEHSFVLVCEGRNLTDEEFDMMIDSMRRRRCMPVTFPTTTITTNFEELREQFLQDEQNVADNESPGRKS